MKKFYYKLHSVNENNYPTFIINIKKKGCLPPKNGIFMKSIDEKTSFNVQHFDKDTGKQIIFTTIYDNYKLIIIQHILINKLIMYIKKIQRNNQIEGIIINKHIIL